MKQSLERMRLQVNIWNSPITGAGLTSRSRSLSRDFVRGFKTRSRTSGIGRDPEPQWNQFSYPTSRSESVSHSGGVSSDAAADRTNFFKLEGKSNAGQGHKFRTLINDENLSTEEHHRLRVSNFYHLNHNAMLPCYFIIIRLHSLRDMLLSILMLHQRRRKTPSWSSSSM